MKPLIPFEPFKIDCLFKQRCSGFVHEGWDLNGVGGGNTDCGTPLRAVADGEIVHYSESNKDYGKLVVLKCKTVNGDRYVRYTHCREVFIRSGLVKRGDRLALMGSTGNSTACHLHLDVFKNPQTNWRFYRSNVETYFEDPQIFFNSDIINQMEFTDQTKIPLGGEWGELELQAVRSILSDQRRDVEAFAQTNKSLAEQVKKANERIQVLEQDRKELEERIRVLEEGVNEPVFKNSVSRLLYLIAKSLG